MCWLSEYRNEPFTPILHSDDFVRQLECLQAESIPATEEIVRALFALAESIPKVIRNKHRFYRIFFRVRDICAELHRMPKRGTVSTNWIEVSEDLTETLNSLSWLVPSATKLCIRLKLFHSVIPIVFQIIKHEMQPFELRSLQTWNHSCEILKSIAEELSKDGLQLHQVYDISEAKKDQYFDECSWLSRIFHEGIVTPVEQTFVSDNNIPTEVRSVVDRLENLVEEVKLLDAMDESIREIIIRITSDIASKLVSTNDSLTQDLTETLNLNWARVSELWIAPDSALNIGVVTQAKEPTTIYFSENLIHLEYEPTPTTQQVIILLQETGKIAITARRHKHKLYSILLRARNICNYILSLGQQTKDHQPTDTKDLLRSPNDYSNITKALQGELNKLFELLLKEKGESGPAAYSTWRESRAAVTDIQVALNREPFDTIPSNPSQNASQDSFFDDCAWISSLLHDDLEPAIARRLPDRKTVPEALFRVEQSLGFMESEVEQGDHEQEEELQRRLIAPTSSQHSLFKVFDDSSNVANLPIRSSLSPDESIIQPGVQLYEMPPQIEGVLTETAWVGGGGFSDVYRGEWTQVGQNEPTQVAIKRLRPISPPHAANPADAKAMFERPPIIHADIKPENVMISENIRAVLSDFGVSRFMVEMGIRTGSATSGGAPGTASYQAKEILESGLLPTNMSDVYAFGGLILAVR
ncbi:hypothetical protein FS837_007574 [Tulasnella sp. UAMH 9824]|nr:hypothetical protein FS837_007574 [Tulasnella sp. UAMH 9824]